MNVQRVEQRADKRELIKKARRKAEFAKKLIPLQQEYISEVVEAGKDHVRVKYLSVFDSTVQAALIEETDLNYEQIYKIIFRCGELMKEGFDALVDMSYEERIMKVKGIEDEVASFIANMIFEKKTRTEIVKIVREKYAGTGITTQDINIYWKKGKEAYDKFIIDQDGIKKAVKISDAIKENNIEAAAEYILGERSKMAVKSKKESKKTKVDAIGVVAEGEIVITEPNSKFKVTNQIVRVVEADIAGSHAEYKIKNGIVTIVGTKDAFENAEAVKNWAADKKEELLKKIEKLELIEAETIEVIKEFI